VVASKEIHKKIMGKTVLETKCWYIEIIEHYLPSKSLVNIDREINLMGKVT
jgi:hypothetical protein